MRRGRLARMLLQGFHGQKHSGVRRKEFRELPDSSREKLTGTSARPLDIVYDNVGVEDTREALERLASGDRPAQR
jgi:hypothetical protein